MRINGEEQRFGLGIPTFMGGVPIAVEQTADYDVAFLGIPIETAASYRRGTAKAARALREYADWDDIGDKNFIDLDRDKLLLHSTAQRIGDLGDMVLDETNQERYIPKIITYAGNIAASCVPVFIGGDHSITYSTFQGARSRIHPDQKVGILHFDAHFDVEDAYPNMPKIWHGNVFRELIREGHIEGHDLFTVGVRGTVPKKWVDYADHKGINYFTSQEVIKDKQTVIEKVAAGLSAYDQIYVTLDVDGLDTAYAPGTGVPRFNGLLPQDIIDFFRACIKKPLLAADIVEYSPTYDTNGQTAITICDLAYELLAFRGKT